jgi:cytochrome P450
MKAVQAEPPLEFARVEPLGDRIIGRINAAREHGAIWWSEEERSWVVSGHAEVAEGFQLLVPLSNDRSKLMAGLVPDDAERMRIMPNTVRYFRHFLINLEGTAHVRMRRLMTKAFSRKVAENYRPFARQVIVETLDAVKGRDEVEFVEEIAREITGRNLLRIIGLEDEAFYMPRLKYWSYIANAGLGGHASLETIAEMDRAFGEMVEVFQKEIDRRRANPGKDFLSQLILADDNGDRFSDDELLGNMHLILIAGHDTTLNTMALSVNALSKNAEARSYMREHPDDSLNSMLELMRYIAMSTEMTRLVAEDFEWRGHHLQKGQIVHLMIAGANRDPKVFAEPEKLDLTRNTDASMTFAPGVHHCIGHLFAKMQLTEFFPAFLDRYDSWEVLEDELPFGGGLSFRGPQAMHLRLVPR